MKAKEALCWECHKWFSKDRLSHNHLCYTCALKGMIANFNALWDMKYKREVKDESSKDL